MSSFSDPLTRQLAEAVRIEHRGADILNSKSEFSRCKIPRLRLNMEEWTSFRKKASTLQEEEVMVKESTAREGDDQSLMGDLEVIETEARRMEKKRKGNKEERKPKRRKLEKLVGWGEPTETDSSQQEGMEAWRIKVTTKTAGVLQEAATESRLGQET